MKTPIEIEVRAFRDPDGTYRAALEVGAYIGLQKGFASDRQAIAAVLRAYADHVHPDTEVQS